MDFLLVKKLDQPEMGGATTFNELKKRVNPVLGSAVLWYNLLKNGSYDWRSR
jgi:hypothetical protein